MSSTEAGKPRFSYDARCEELAEHFLDEKPRNDEHVRKLAQTIQDAIEDWLRERDEASSQPKQVRP